MCASRRLARDRPAASQVHNSQVIKFIISQSFRKSTLTFTFMGRGPLSSLSSRDLDGWLNSRYPLNYYTVTQCNFSNQCKTMSIRRGGPTDRSRYYSCVIDDLVKGATIFSFRFKPWNIHRV